jgi:hypothetical protein
LRIGARDSQAPRRDIERKQQRSHGQQQRPQRLSARGGLGDRRKGERGIGDRLSARGAGQFGQNARGGI